MVEPQMARSPLGQLADAAETSTNGPAGVVLAERAFLGKLVLRGEPSDGNFLAAAQSALGIDLPTRPNTASDGAGLTALWLGPNEWLVVTPPGGETAPAIGLKVALSGHHAAVTDVSDARTVVRVSGRHAREVLAKGCPIDLHERSFAPGRVAQSVVARAGVILHQVDATPSYDLYVLASFSAYLWNWLTDSALEFGLAIRKPA
ncbi:MAG: sarcosine oxidase subunit gamma [Alphaproteobacteria bacterium]|nr:sarcosine oxidase subunit gamma [Alphaproteobacteria bacterium]